ncbi:ParA family protein [Ihubacter sp. mB4P-1]|uniref:ParA family protein n=1 Tax=Ihubacter sp. mB4P-1 TaxID=3242370 RepID=UPI002170700A|nr:ParA family protein [Emergencia sp.]
MKARVISVNNQKGGVGKTTTALAMAAILTEQNKQVLLIDCDGSSTTLTKILCQQAEVDYRQLAVTLTDLILFKTLGRDATAFADRAVIHCPESYDLLPADNKLVSIAAALATQNDMEIRFKALAGLVDYYRRYYDYIILDAAPVLDLFATNQLVAADELLIVSQCQKASREAIHELVHTVDSFVHPINPNLQVKGILLTMLDKRAKYGKEQIREMREEFADIHIFDAVISRATEAERYVDSGHSIICQSPKGSVTQGYREFMKEFLMERQVK